MPQTPYDVVKAAIRFQKPDRLPVNMPLLDLCDFHHVGWKQIGTGDRSKRQTLDEWGCLWVRNETDNMGQVKGFPLEDWAVLPDYEWLDADDPALYEGMEEQFEGSEGKFVMTSIFMLLFERMHALHGFENTLVDLRLEPERMKWLADRIVDINLRIMDNIARRFPGRIHGFSFTDDWGTELDVFIRPDQWDEFFKPRYKKLFDAAHSYGWIVWMHSCGKINAILESLIEIGLDVIEPQQPRVLGIEEIGHRFRGRICFASLCDIQHTLPFKSDAEIREEARLLLNEWATPDGGFILIDYGDGAAIGVGMEKKQVMLEAFLAADPYS